MVEMFDNSNLFLVSDMLIKVSMSSPSQLRVFAIKMNAEQPIQEIYPETYFTCNGSMVDIWSQVDRL